MDWPFPPQAPANLGVISTLALAATAVSPRRATPASAAWGTNNKAIYIPFRTTAPLIVRQMFCFNGSTANGNVDIGVYDARFTLLVSTGSTAQAGTSALQVIDVTDTEIGVGTFYLALALSSTSGTIFRTSEANNAFASAFGLLQQTASAFPLPATGTPVTTTGSNRPVFGLTTRTVI